ncbi:FAD/NAD(P)-binding protein [Actinokineospora sp. NBRC 105648]|uniref:FAD/NAD(P)-binding protein n=1 Tax=Actinokineospora sp. NBRC 105648 TaxID=3032206 RepID=UPI0025542E4D|nr:FAD/NAD(P)-binding protein [Actinokineospora sp. NBRC 105648]
MRSSGARVPVPADGVRSVRQVCVVGAGPRGVCVVERLCANASELIGVDQQLVVHVVDPAAGGGGAVWSTGQPAELLMNTVTSQVTLFGDDSVECAGPIRPGPTLYEWVRSLSRMDSAYPDHILREAGRLGPNDYSTRACYGHYLDWVLRELVERADERVRVVVHRKTAASVDDAADGTQVVTLDDGTILSTMDSVVLAQGHVPMPPEDAEQALATHAAQHDLVYLPPANPADVDLSGVRAGTAVALRGVGLNFFDYLALLTEGRGGQFTEQGGQLVYLPSGREPLVYAGSRRGIPYHGRGENQKGVAERHVPRFLTGEVIEKLRIDVPGSFRRDVWPLVSLEVRSVYYATLLGPGFLAEYLPAVARGVEAERALLDRYDLPLALRWDWDWIARPYRDRTFADHTEFRAWLLDYLRADLREARRGNRDSPVKAALDVLRDLRNEVRLVVDHGGLTGRSYRDDLQGWYTPFNAFLSIGPPARRIAELTALIEADVVRPVGPGLVITPTSTGFDVSSALVPGPPVPVAALVEARLPEVDVRRTTDPLIRHLLAHGHGTPYVIDDHQTGGLTVTERPYHLVDATGHAHPRRFAFGIPTEAVHWATAAGARPGVNSVILADADAIARASILAANPEPTQPEPTRPELTQPKPTRAEPTRLNSAQAELTQPGATRPAATRPALAQSDPARPGSIDPVPETRQAAGAVPRPARSRARHPR